MVYTFSHLIVDCCLKRNLPIPRVDKSNFLLIMVDYQTYNTQMCCLATSKSSLFQLISHSLVILLQALSRNPMPKNRS